MFKTTGSARENQAARQNLVDAGYTVLDGEVPGLPNQMLGTIKQRLAAQASQGRPQDG